MNNLFQIATRRKMRFTSIRGLMSAEDLWEIPLRSKDGFNLNEIAKEANRKVKAADEESFVDVDSTPESRVVEMALAVVMQVIEVMLDEEKTQKKAAENAKERQKLLRILAEKKVGALSDLSVAELEKRINDLT